MISTNDADEPHGWGETTQKATGSHDIVVTGTGSGSQASQSPPY